MVSSTIIFFICQYLKIGVIIIKPAVHFAESGASTDLECGEPFSQGR